MDLALIRIRITNRRRMLNWFIPNSTAYKGKRCFALRAGLVFLKSLARTLRENACMQCI